MKYSKFLYIVIILQAILICYLMFTNMFILDNRFEESTSIDEKIYNVYLGEDLVTFRDKEGKKLSTIEYQNNVYIPVSDKGLFLNYSVDLKDKNIYLKPNLEDMSDFLNINCETIDGSVFTNDDLMLYDYTIILNWSTWCPDCDEVLKNIKEVLHKLDGENVQFVGLLMDDTSDINKLRKSVNTKLDKYGLDFVNILPNDEIVNRLQTNVKSIPNFYVLDNKAKLVSNDVIGIEDLLENLKELKENDCNEC